MDELRGTLYDTNCMMAENERMLSEYRDVTHSKSREMNIVRACVHVWYKYGYDGLSTR